MAYDFEDFTYPPAGGRVKLILLGVVVPGVFAYWGAHAWITEQAIWPGRRGSNITVYGDAAQAMAIMHFSIAAFFNFRWMWGMMQFYRVFEIGTAVSLLSFLGGLLYGLCSL